MNVDLGSDLEQRIQERMATGKYSSAEDVIRKALDSLANRDQLIADIEASLEDEQRGDVLPLKELDRRMREELPFLNGT